MDDRLLRVGVMGAAAILLPTLLGLVLGLPVLVCVLVALALLGVAVAVERRRGRASEPWPVHSAPRPEVVSHTRELPEAQLDTNTPDYRFSFAATVSWQVQLGAGRDPHVDPGALAVDAIIDRAAAAARDFGPSDAVRAQHRLEAVLGVRSPDPSGAVRAWATSIRVVVPAEDEDRIRRLAAHRKTAAEWEHERRREQDLRRYLREDALSTPGSAVVWWLARHLDRVEDAVRLIDRLGELSAVAQDRPRNVPGTVAEQAPFELVVPSGQNGRVTATDLVDHVLPDPADDRRLLFARDLARVLDQFDLNEQGARLRSAFGIGHAGDEEETSEEEAAAVSADSSQIDGYGGTDSARVSYGEARDRRS
jgi:hypothetical protein